MTNREDQARLPIYRATLLIQVAAAGFFGVAPYIFPDWFATFFGYEGAEPFIYRLLGAAALGYAGAALVGFGQPRWSEHRIPAIATVTFNVAAVAAALVSLAEGSATFLALFILVAASLFTIVAGYWLIRDRGPRAPRDPHVGTPFRIVLALATAAAAFFGLLPLVVPEQFAELSGFATSDLFIYRLAGAAALGYAVAGIFEVASHSAAEIRLQVRAALVFNALSAVAAAMYLIGGGTSPVAWLILIAAALFSVAFAWWLSAGPRT